MSTLTRQSPKAYLDGLNEDQQQAVLRTRGPLLVLAGAGTGKTRVVTCRIAHLIATGVKPDQILAVTFTKKAAAEMKQRVDSLLGGKASGLTVCTFHALGYRMLAENHIRTSSSGCLNLLSPAQQRNLVAEILNRQHLDGLFAVHAAVREISRVKTARATESIIARDSISERLVAEYQRTLDENQQIDFDDLLILPLQVLQESSHPRTSYRQRWPYLLVDEYQDTNELQHRLVKLLAGKERNICVVGDDDQSIYGFRGANADKILNFGREFRGAHVIKLERNYRSSTEILDLANSVIERAAERYRKRLHSQCGSGGLVLRKFSEDAEAESEAIAQWISARRRSAGAHWSDMAVLFRVQSDAQLLKNELRQRGIPFQSTTGVNGSIDKVTITTLHRSKGL